MKAIMSAEYKNFFTEIKERIHKAQSDALKAVNKELINLYWDIGRSIVAKQDTLGWGKAVVETLAKDLQKEFPGIQGFSSANLWRMQKFYLTYHSNEKLAPMVREISWTKNIIIMERCKDDIRREFYLKTTKKLGWTKELERALLENVRKFLIEMGGYFTFVGNQYRLEIEEQEFFIDLLLYHRQLRCLVAIELKVGAFKPEYAGKMQFYLSVLNDRTKLPDENPSIGIILCKDKSRTIVEYALKDTKKPIGVSTYKLTEKLPRGLKKYLPSPEEMIERIKCLD